MSNEYNLIDEPWIPVADHGRVGLGEVFSRTDIRALGGNPIHKLAVMKLLLAIAQAACTPEDEDDWRKMGPEGLASNCHAYLEKWRDRFFLFGEAPFLQMPAVESLVATRTEARLKKAKTPGQRKQEIQKGAPKPFGAGFYPDLPSDNNSMLSHTMLGKELDSGEQALFVLTLMNFAFAGKRVEGGMTSLAGTVLSDKHSAPAGPGLGGFVGQLHGLVVTGDLRKDVWLNMLTKAQIEKANRWTEGVGRPAWEAMPAHEQDARAKAIRESYQGCLVGVSRFVYLKEGGIYYLDGIQYPKVSEGWFEPTLMLDQSDKLPKAKYVNLEKRPWRELPAFLSFLESGSTAGFENMALRVGVQRMSQRKERLCVWTGGIRVSSTSGDQSAKQDDDFLESTVWIDGDDLGTVWLDHLDLEMKGMDKLASTVYGCVRNYFADLHATPEYAGAQAALASNLFWQFCERDFQTLVDNCEQGERESQAREALRHRFVQHAHKVFDLYAPRETARQLEAWANRRPNAPAGYLETTERQQPTIQGA
ncbi:type I-E CRISPR-associated protein Cse1/CasA [Guyparkeria sp. GHLCS8-2]|uniref:type I-E CRISPR-associated protein Cse1/CasA n=1 Tax=Guyparkeria halopsychrophila TaxID=3139421 RepID=UPI0037CA3169